MKASAQIEYENGVLRIDAVVEGRAVHHRVEFALPAALRRIEDYLADACAMVPTFAWHQPGHPCKECLALETQKGTRHA